MTADLTPEQKGDERRARVDNGMPPIASDDAWAAEYTGQRPRFKVVQFADSASDWPMSGDALALTKAGVIA